MHGSSPHAWADKRDQLGAARLLVQAGAEIDLADVAKARARIPSLQHGRRFEIVEPMAEPAHLHIVRGTE